MGKDEVDQEKKDEPAEEEKAKQAEEMFDRPLHLYLIDSYLFWTIFGILGCLSIGGKLPFMYPRTEQLAIEREGFAVMAHKYLPPVKPKEETLCRTQEIKEADVLKNSFFSRMSKRSSNESRTRFRLVLRLKVPPPRVEPQPGDGEEPTEKKTEKKEELPEELWLSLDPTNEGKSAEALKCRMNQWLGVEELKTEKDRKKELLLASKAKLD